MKTTENLNTTKMISLTSYRQRLQDLKWLEDDETLNPDRHAIEESIRLAGEALDEEFMSGIHDSAS